MKPQFAGAAAVQNVCVRVAGTGVPDALLTPVPMYMVTSSPHENGPDGSKWMVFPPTTDNTPDATPDHRPNT
ncbi:MAG: hypothetical protein CMJ90_13525 [Planctomycetes bacterium]|nr:hypothetical protein [Planctomycetota bacterium]